MKKQNKLNNQTKKKKGKKNTDHVSQQTTSSSVGLSPKRAVTATLKGKRVSFSLQVKW